ncbi:MAG: SDR family oxidoreductase [Pseudomonadota bacterium]
MGELTGKTIIVTGASKGIGAAIAKHVAHLGAHVIAHFGADRVGAEAALKACPAERKRFIGCNFGDPPAADAFWQEAEAWRGRIDALVANAAVMLPGSGIEDTDAEWDRVWDETLRVNVLSPSRLMRAAVRHYLAHGGGAIVTLTSWVTHRGSSVPDALAYAASKAAISAVTKTIARTYARDNIAAYCVSPGVVRTRMSEEAAAAQGGEAAVAAGLTMGEWVPPEDIAEVVGFLCAGRSRHLTGATIDVNGASYVR